MPTDITVFSGTFEMVGQGVLGAQKRTTFTGVGSTRGRNYHREIPHDEQEAVKRRGRKVDEAMGTIFRSRAQYLWR